MSRQQPTARYSLNNGASFARKINNNRNIAQHVVDATFYDERISQPVKGCIAQETFGKGNITVRINEKFYMVASKFAHRYYVVANQDGVWKCSSSDDRVQAACIALVQLHVQKKSALLLSAAYE